MPFHPESRLHEKPRPSGRRSPFFLQALHLLLEQQLGLTVAAEARTGAEALAHVERDDFDLILMDVHLPDANGIEISRRILDHRKDAKIIILTADADPHRIDEALLTGVLGYVLKINTTEELQHAIIAVSAKTRYLSPEANAALLAGYPGLCKPRPTSSKPLSTHEHEAICVNAAGLNL